MHLLALALIWPQSGLERFSVSHEWLGGSKNLIPLLLSLPPTDCVHSRQFTMEAIWSLSLFAALLPTPPSQPFLLPLPSQLRAPVINTTEIDE